MSVKLEPVSMARLPGSPEVKPPLPQGRCRYILLLPEVKGQRCGCVSFGRNTGIPSATCNCGHHACYHLPDPGPSAEEERVCLQNRIQALEVRLDQGAEDVTAIFMSKLASLEEDMDRHRDLVGEQIKGAYNNSAMNWRSVQQIERTGQQHQSQINQLQGKLDAQEEQLRTLRESLAEREHVNKKLEDVLLTLARRLEGGAPSPSPPPPPPSRRVARRLRRRLSADTARPASCPVQTEAPSARPSGAKLQSETSRHLQQLRMARPRGLLKPCLAYTTTSNPAWVVHISLLPTADMMMPFEKNTTAYQRCFSRGLLQAVAVPGHHARSFTAAVSKAFGGVLRGREWMPLQAKDCCEAVDGLQGPPMLRRLEQHLVDAADYSHAFLRAHCGVVDRSHAIDSLYIAMRHHTISWHAMRRAPVYHEGLEASWEFDGDLDKDPLGSDSGVDEADRPAAAAGDIAATMTVPARAAQQQQQQQHSLKRPAAEMTRPSSGDNSSASLPIIDGDGCGGAKRLCPDTPVDSGMVRQEITTR